MDTAYEATPELALADTFGPEMKVFGLAIVFSLILIAIFRFGFKSNREIGKGVTFKKPEAYDPKQKTTLRLMLIMMAVVLIFPLLKLLFPNVGFIKTVAGKIDVGLVAFIFTVLAFLAPITMAICEESKMDKLTGAVAINCGAPSRPAPSRPSPTGSATTCPPSSCPSPSASSARS